MAQNKSVEKIKTHIGQRGQEPAVVYSEDTDVLGIVSTLKTKVAPASNRILERAFRAASAGRKTGKTTGSVRITY